MTFQTQVYNNIIDTTEINEKLALKKNSPQTYFNEKLALKKIVPILI